MRGGAADPQTLVITEHGRHEFNFSMSGPSITITVIPLKGSYFETKKLLSIEAKAREEKAKEDKAKADKAKTDKGFKKSSGSPLR